MTDRGQTRRDALRELAEAATDGPWYYDGRDIFTVHTGEGGHRLVIPLPETWHESQQVNEADARYIAAVSPDVLLALLTELEQAERECDARRERVVLVQELGEKLRAAEARIAELESS